MAAWPIGWIMWRAWMRWSGPPFREGNFRFIIKKGTAQARCTLSVSFSGVRGNGHRQPDVETGPDASADWRGQPGRSALGSGGERLAGRLATDVRAGGVFSGA